MQGFRSRDMYRLRFVRTAFSSSTGATFMRDASRATSSLPNRKIASLIRRDDEIIYNEIIFFDTRKYLQIFISNRLCHSLSINEIIVHPI